MPCEHAAAAILSVGDELTLGQALDTNSCWLADRLAGLGIVAVEHVTVPDDAEALAGALRRLAGAAPLVITTGGLGPTADDLTREGLARATGEPLVEDSAALRWIESWFARASRPMPALNRSQALRPRSASCLENTAGTAPGLAGRVADADVFCLPGPPREMREMFERSVVPRLRPPAGGGVRTRLLHAFGLGESEVAARLGDLMDRARDPLVGTTVSGGVVTCRIRAGRPAPGRDREGASGPDPLDATGRLIHERLDPYVFGADGDTLASVVLDELRGRARTLAVVESCTGGVLGAMLTEVPGSSASFVGGWITYTNEMKVREVGVPASLFAPGAPGAVSRECVRAMARGGLERAGADHCLAITGIAGPDGGSPEKPVGTVWVARATRGVGSADRDADVEVRRFLFTGDRAGVREWAARSALAMLRFELVGAAGVRMLRQQE